MLGFILDAVHFFAQLLIWVLIGRAILSWFVNPYTSNRMGNLAKIYYFLMQVTEPMIRPARKLLSRFNTGPLDLSLFVTVIFIVILERILMRILGLLLL
jgi:YggT family protein